MKIVETFLSIQGEGRYMGRLAFFIRLFGCNLSCVGFGVNEISPKTGEKLVGCDTLRAVKTSHFSADELNSHDLIDKISTLEFRPMIIITGGEPLLHYKDTELLKLLSWLIANNYLVQFETNGTIEIDFCKFNIYSRCIFAVSPKLSNSGEKSEKRINKNALNSLFQNADCFYKFVVNSQQDLSEISEILALQKGEVWCMPLGANKVALELSAQQIAQICVNSGFNYSDRLHIRLWNDKSGV